MPERQKGDVLTGFLWMFFLSLLLFWLPVIGSFIAGFVGGRKAGELGSAILAALLPAIIIGAFFFFLGGSLTGLPLIGVLVASGAFVIALFASLPLILGAIIGGATA